MAETAVKLRRLDDDHKRNAVAQWPLVAQDVELRHQSVLCASARPISGKPVLLFARPRAHSTFKPHRPKNKGSASWRRRRHENRYAQRDHPGRANGLHGRAAGRKGRVQPRTWASVFWRRMRWLWRFSVRWMLPCSAAPTWPSLAARDSLRATWAWPRSSRETS